MSSKLYELTPLKLKGAVTKPVLIAARPIITVRQALKTMANNNITSLPIYSHDSDNLVNIVNLFDILSFIIKEAVADERLPFSLDSEKVNKLDNSIEVVMTLDNDQESYRIVKVDANESLKDILGKFSKGIHRSLVIDYTNNTPPYILTQTDIVKYVQAHPEYLPTIDFNASLISLGLAGKQREIIMGCDNETALNVYRKMAEKNLTGIAIVDGDQKIVGNLSASDLRGLNYKSIDNLILPVLEFIATLSSSEIASSPITATTDTKLGEILKTVVDNHIHRVWIVDNQSRVIDVVTLTDLIGLFVRQ